MLEKHVAECKGRTVNVHAAITKSESPKIENTVHSQSEPCVERLYVAFGGLTSSAALPMMNTSWSLGYYLDSKLEWY